MFYKYLNIINDYLGCNHKSGVIKRIVLLLLLDINATLQKVYLKHFILLKSAECLCIRLASCMRK